MDLIEHLVHETCTPAGTQELWLRAVDIRIHLVADHETVAFALDTFCPPGVGGVDIQAGPDGSGESLGYLTLWDIAMNVCAIGRLRREIERSWHLCSVCSPVADAYFSVYETGGIQAFVEQSGDDDYLILRDADRILALSTPGAHKRRKAVRLIREIAGRRLEDAGYVAFHASAFSVRSRGMIVIGPSGAGKSTLALAMATYTDAEWIGNDRIMVGWEEGNNRLSATAFPLPVRVNYGTLEALDWNHDEWLLHQARPSDASDWRQFNGQHKMTISAGELQRLTQIRLIDHTTVAAAAYPVIDRQSDGWQVQETDHPDLLAESCLAGNDHVYPEDWLRFRASSEPDMVQRGREILSAIRSLPAFEVRIGASSNIQSCCRNLHRAICTLHQPDSVPK